MKHQSQHSEKKLISNTLFIAFFAVVIFIGYMSDAFKIPIKTPSELIEATQTFTANELAPINQITLFNNNGPFIFQKDPTEGKWHLISPEKHEKESAFIEKLMSSLGSIKTKNVLDYNNSNLTNYSLINSPNKLILTSMNNQDSINIHFGLINTIDNSTYMRIEGKNNIYHVEAPISNFDSITLADLVEKKPFEFSKDLISQIKISNLKNKKLNFSAKKNETGWIGDDEKPVEATLVNDFIEDMTKLKSNKLITQVSKDQDKALKNLMNKVEIQINIKLQDGREFNYNVTELTKSFPEISLNDEYHYVIKESGDETLHFIRSENLAVFNIKSTAL